VASVRINTAQVDAFERRLRAAAQSVENEGREWQQEWGEEWADEMRDLVSVDTGQTKNAIEQVEPGGITFGDRARIASFLEHGTSRMAPRPFIGPAMRRIKEPAEKDAAKRGISLIAKG
jgi:HK97 gp10 family phage protein